MKTRINNNRSKTRTKTNTNSQKRCNKNAEPKLIFRNCPINQVIGIQRGDHNVLVSPEDAKKCGVNLSGKGKAAKRDAEVQTASEDPALSMELDPENSESSYGQLRILLHEEEDFIRIVKMLKLCTSASNLAEIVVDNILPISDTVLDHILKDPLLTEMVSITKIVKGGSIGNVRTQIKNYKMLKDNANKAKSKGGLSGNSGD